MCMCVYAPPAFMSVYVYVMYVYVHVYMYVYMYMCMPSSTASTLSATCILKSQWPRAFAL